VKKVYVIGGKRTAIGRFMGTLSEMHPAEYGASVVKELLKSSGVSAETVDEVLVGNILPAGLGQGVARQISIKAGVPKSVPAYGVNMVCGSGMKTVMNGYMSLQNGWHDIVIAGGVEAMSKTPYILPDKLRKGNKMGGFNVKDHMIDDALMDAFDNIHMGVTAENIAKKYNISREEQDEFALASQEKAASAQDAGRFDDEIVPITVKTRKEEIVFDEDEHLNRGANKEKLAKLRPAFVKDGTITAANASGINDGASFMLLASEDAVQKHNLKPLFEVVGIGQGGVAPDMMGMGPIPAIEAALKHADLDFDKLDLLELNEAFAAQGLGVMRELSARYGVSKEKLMEKTNVNGGAIALGHPVGASGNRITVTLMHEMLKRKSTYGLASLCIGGGMGTAIILKRMENA